MILRYISILLFLLYSCDSVAQLDYFPNQRDGVSDEKYRRGIQILTSTYDAVKKSNNTFTYMDHMNLMSAYITLKEPRQKVLEQLDLAQQKDLSSTAELFLMAMKKEHFKDYLTDDEFDSLYNKFSKIVEIHKKDEVDLESYAKEGGYDLGLVKLMALLQEKDRKYRGTDKEDLTKQNYIDLENIQVIDSLYSKFNTYIGKSLVGDKFKHVMWLVIQHADLDHQEDYLPILHKAVLGGELPGTPLKMLIDRVYAKKHGYQIYGSQSGVELASDEIIKQVKEKYKI